MNHKTPIRASIALAVVLCGGFAMAEKPAPSVELDPRCTRLEFGGDFVPGQMIALADGSLMTVRGAATVTTRDDGKTWSAPRPIDVGPGPGQPSDACVAVEDEVRRGDSRLHGHRRDALRVGHSEQRGHAGHKTRRLGGPEPRRGQDLDRPPAAAGRLLRGADQHHPDHRRPRRRARPVHVGPQPPRHVHLRLGRRRPLVAAGQRHRPWRTRRPRRRDGSHRRRVVQPPPAHARADQPRPLLGSLLRRRSLLARDCGQANSTPPAPRATCCDWPTVGSRWFGTGSMPRARTAPSEAPAATAPASPRRPGIAKSFRWPFRATTGRPGPNRWRLSECPAGP